MTDPSWAQGLRPALNDLAREAAPSLLADAFREAQEEAKAVLRHEMVDALLTEAGQLGARTLIRDEPDNEEARANARTVETGLYVYGFTSAVPSPTWAVSGVNGARVSAIAESGVAAIVSDVAATPQAWGIDENGEPDLTLLAPRMHEHERVLEAALAEFTVVPMRFGIVYPCQEALRDVLRVHAPELHAAIGQLAGKVEWGLTVTRERRTTSGRPTGDGTHVAGRAYLNYRESERAAAAQEAERNRGAAAAIHQAADAVASASILHPPKRATGAAEAGAESLLRASYLVGDTDRARFEQTIVEALDAGSDLGLKGELTGPWPAYNFSNIELTGAPA
ncbi:MAG: GvpL/GvpF family gas vesicle protein [Acidimicrobiaceae bacterium]|nr:GvpL/GvpF family gas vesicle protein [Acidimicrobiaceae bacterium]